MVLDGRCSCSGVITVSGKGHVTKNNMNFQKVLPVSFSSKSSQLRREEQHLITPSLVHGMYDRLYHVIDRNCHLQNNTASPFSCHPRAAHRMRTKHRSIIVAKNLIVANIFFSCLTGPIKKHVLAKAAVFPKV